MRRLVCRGLVVGLLSGGVWGCSATDAIGTPPIQTTDPYAALRLNVRAAMMATKAPYDTLQLIPTAYDVNGQVIPLPGPVTYTVNDTTLHISASGLLRVTGVPKSNAAVVASVQDTMVRLTHNDTAFIAATTTVPASPLASFSIHPMGADSAVLDLDNGSTKTLTVTALDATGTVIPLKSLLIHYASGNTVTATINAKTGVVSSVYLGNSLLTASTTYYGVTKTDTLAFRIGYPDTTSISIQGALLPDGSYRYSWTLSNLVIGVGKTVIFKIPYLNFPLFGQAVITNIGSHPVVGDQSINAGVSVVFDDSSVAHASVLPTSLLAAQFASTGTGNVSLQVPDSFVVADSTDGTNRYYLKLTAYCESAPFPCATARAFSTPGTYGFHSATTGAAGTITVVAP